ncbi:uncharacterized protein Dana_GF13126, isoform B [Drosophila ananassae]|uniref:5'-nucleotidase n=1 Tax=Drosophila ananassae TaxID=7217 RepID=B3MG78_DROAN|nr:protein 5NUC isoform X2 [Drosophila ananassae]EDV36773.2 uncharacterized protein Dana_GF13126, isoform B [Drosophila ananassae]
MEIFCVRYYIIVGLWLLGVLAPVVRLETEEPKDIEFIILHNNDMHSRFEQTNARCGNCLMEDARQNKCYGGFARVAHIVRKYRKEAQAGGTPVIYLNAGDTYSGKSWFTIYKHKIVSDFLNKLSPDAICLGNHEFDHNIQGLVPFLNAVTFPVVACNLDVSREPNLAASKQLSKSTILNVNGVMVGIIGYITPDTKFWTPRNSAKFLDEVVSINAEAERLKENGVNIIIALGHSGYEKDMEIAKDCPEVDIVVGGHSHTYLDANKPVARLSDTNPEAVRGPYPTTVVQDSGKKVPVVQVYAFTKYMGFLRVKFDKEGNLEEFSGAPILLGPNISEEIDVLYLLEEYRPKVEELEKRINAKMGDTKLLLKAATCKEEECLLGNFMTDAMVYARMLEDKGGKYWTDAPIALLHAGAIKGSISKGTISADTINSVLPEVEDLMVIQMSGEILWKALEYSAEVRLQANKDGFLQVSGLMVTTNFRGPKGKRIESVNILCAECEVPAFEPLDESLTYNVIVPASLVNGCEGHDFGQDANSTQKKMRWNNRKAIMEYAKRCNIVIAEIEGRLGDKYSQTSIASVIVVSIKNIIFLYLLTKLL